MSVTLEARYVGGNPESGYRVNVKNANPTGMIGDGGVLRYFDTKTEAVMYTNLVNATGKDVFTMEREYEKDRMPERYDRDGFVRINAKDVEGVEDCPKISWGRAAFSRLTDEQIRIINETGRLPEGTKFVCDGMGGYTLSNNYGGIVTGTRTLPEGFELKKDWLGFTVIVPKDTESVFVKDIA